jgi:hypothetical protein
VPVYELLNGIEYQAMGRPKKERKFLHVLALNGGPMTHPTTFATPFGGRRDARYLVDLSRCNNRASLLGRSVFCEISS